MPTSLDKALAWLAHLYTALGLVVAAAIAVLIVDGSDRSLRLAFLLMLLATLVDATDGWLARRVRVKEVLPDFSGDTLDTIIDFQTYTSLPLLLLWRAQALPGTLVLVLLLPLLASAYGFSQVQAKTRDGFFLGFPSYWNIVAFYVYFVRPPAWIAVSVITMLAALTFVPTPYLYATRGGPFSRVILVGGAIWSVLLLLILVGPAGNSRTLVLSSLAYPLLYLALSAVVAFRRPRPARVDSAAARSTRY